MPMQKPAETSQPIIDVIKNRWSPRAFTDQLPTNDMLVSLFEAARWTASCNNSQPWRFIVATKDNRAGADKFLDPQRAQQINNRVDLGRRVARRHRTDINRMYR